MQLRLKLLFLVFFCTTCLFGRVIHVDSLLSVLENAKDTSRIKILIDLANFYNRQGDIAKAKSYCEQAISLSEKAKDSFFLSRSYYVKGEVNNSIGDFSLALNNLLKAYHLAEKISNKRLLYAITNALGNTYFAQKNCEKSLEYYDLAFKYASELNDVRKVNSVLIGKSNIYILQKKYGYAIDVLSKAAEGAKNSGNSDLYIAANLNMAEVYLVQNNTSKALEVINSVYPIIQKDNKYIWGSTLLLMANAYKQAGDYEKALANYYKSAAVFTASSANYDLQKVYLGIAEAYHKKLQNDSAFAYMQLYSGIKDSIFTEESAKLVAEMQTKYESEKKEKENKLLLSERKLAEGRIKQQERLQIGLLLFLAVIIGFAFFLFRSNKRKQRDNLIILKQKEEVDKQRGLLLLKNSEILDSINYAKRLQEAILPSIRTIKKYLPDFFITYSPKDIVAGDFYWFERIKTGRDTASLSSWPGEKLLIAAADCTGHGVPGAIMSVVCSDALNRTVKEFGITDPGEILNKVQELVVETLVKDENEDVVKDGMDISLVRFEMGSENLVNIKWAGAYNPLWIIKKRTTVKNDIASENLKSADPGFELLEIKADKQPIGKLDVSKPFTTHSFTLSKGDSIYLFTDGYADQFGGRNGKKFKYKQLKELLLASAHLPMKEQRRVLEKTIDDWKGPLEQVDDILVIGIRI
jgi:serine phosphatase RsbU (regulator of sigma subunit)